MKQLRTAGCQTRILNRVLSALIIMSFLSCGSALAATEKTLRYDTYPDFDAAKSAGAKNAARQCLLMSHDCEVCALDENDQLVCSSPGIACQPNEWRCYYIEQSK